ncbi:MAG: translation elongation factor Ts [Clostridia bacterium]|nr:translation elongation factor Ts [Clostridia bacterium]MBP3338074.1 translation elongation factor Ts [Lachnospiraceae bacterium]MBR4110996.1 translation elongation factor Ts [Clostridia bacterium]
MISAEQVRELREMTGAGMMECKRVLEETDGNMEKAAELLRERGVVKAAKKAGRIAAEGLVDSYIHGDGRIGVLVEVNIETDFAAKNPEFREFVKDVAMQIAAAKPEYVRREEVPADVVEKEKEIIKAQAMNEGKPAEIAEKMVAGRIDKFFKEICLLEQDFVKNPDITIGKLLTDKIANIGENITIRRFVRFERGEGIQKKEENFADEVMKQING